MKVELLDFKCILIIIYNYLKFLTMVYYRKIFSFITKNDRIWLKNNLK